MGFGEFLGRAANAAMGAAQRNLETMREYEEKYSEYDDDRLIRTFKSASGSRKIACAVVMKQRGLIGSDDE